MRALTIKQPYAWAIAQGIKDIENRSWATNYRGPLLIHAGAAFDRDYRADWPEVLADPPRNLPTSRFVAIVDLVDVIQVEDEENAEEADAIDAGELDIEEISSPWAFGPVLWLLENARELPDDPAFRCKGKLGLWIPPAAALERLSILTPA